MSTRQGTKELALRRCPVPRPLRRRLTGSVPLLIFSVLLHTALLLLLPAPHSHSMEPYQAIMIQIQDPPEQEPEPEVIPEPEPEPLPEPEPEPEPLPEPEPQPIVEQPVEQQPTPAVETPQLIASDKPADNPLPSGSKPASDPVAIAKPAVPPQPMPITEPELQPEPEPALSTEQIKALLTDYAKNARSRIVNRQSLPEEARRLGHSGSVKLRFVVNGSGQIDSLEIVSGCGFSEIDEQALSAVRSAAPFGSLPKGIGRDSLPMSITLNYRVD